MFTKPTVIVLTGMLVSGELTSLADSNSATSTNPANNPSPLGQTMSASKTALEKALSDAYNERTKLKFEELHLLATLSKSSEAAANDAISLSPTQSISGQVSVSSADGKQINLPGINIGLYTKTQLQQWIEGVNNLTARERASLATLIDYESQKTPGYPRPYRWNPNLLDVLRLEQFVWSSQSRYTNMLSAVRTPQSLETKTDANGNFSINAPPAGGDYYIMATASQQIGDDYQNYLWILKADPTIHPFLLNARNKAADNLVSP